MPKQIARWNPARDVWETQTTGLFCEHSDVFSATWPASGMTAAGTAYELPMSGLHMDASECSLLPTLRATRGGSNTETVALLPTPATEDHGYDAPNRSGGPSLSTAFVVEHFSHPHEPPTAPKAAQDNEVHPET